MNLRVKSERNSSSGEKVCVTPASAQWDYVGFKVYELHPGQKVEFATEQQEVVVVLLSGKADVSTAQERWESIGERMSVFEKIRPYSVYVPAQDEVCVKALTDCEIAVCSAPSQAEVQARLITPDEVGVEHRGKGHTERLIHNILPESSNADKLLVVEVFTPEGHWSSYPPHKHDEDRLPYESCLEETYYHKIEPAHGFAIQRVYTDDRSLDEVIAVQHDDVVLVPRGYHPVSAPPGYQVYYLNVMAGPKRAWKFTNDKDHEWIMDAWSKE